MLSLTEIVQYFLINKYIASLRDTLNFVAVEEIVIFIAKKETFIFPWTQTLAILLD